MKYYVTINQRLTEVTESEFKWLHGGKTVHPYASKVYRGEMTIDEVPEELREEVQTVVDRRIERLGKYECMVVRRSAANETVG